MEAFQKNLAAATLLTLILDAGCLDSLVDLIKKHVIVVLLLIPVLLLVACLIRVFEEDAAFDSVMEHKLVNDTLGLEASLLPRKFRQVVWSLRIVGGQHLEVNLVTLLSSELFLIVAGHIVVFLSEEILVVLEIVVVIVFDSSAGGAFFGGSSSWGHSYLFRFKL